MEQKKIGAFLKELRKEKQKYSKRVCGLFIAAIAAFILYSVLDFMGLAAKSGYEQIASYAMGIVLGTLIFGALYTSRYMAKIQAFKHRLLYKTRKPDWDIEDSGDEKSE